MPVSDLKILTSKLVAALTILPGSVFLVALISLLLMFGVAYVTVMLAGLGTNTLLGSIGVIYLQMTLVFLVVTACGLLWYLPYMALVGAMGAAVGRWAIPLAVLLPSIISALEWVTLGGAHPFATHTWAYLDYRSQMPVSFEVLENVWEGEQRFDSMRFIADTLTRYDWLQAGIGVVFAALAIYLASQYRRRANPT